jgi:hypothetical protein
MPFTQSDVAMRRRIAAQLWVESFYGSGIFDVKWNAICSPNADGIATLDVSQALDGCLEFFTPNPQTIKFHRARKQSKRFYIRYWLEDLSGQIGTYVDTDITVCVKGGIALEHDYESFISSNIIYGQTLHFWHEEELLREDEVKWISFVVNSTLDAKLQPRVILTLEDGSSFSYYPFEQACSTQLGEIFHLPVSLASMDVANNIPPGADTLVKMEIEIWDNNVAFTEKIAFNIDYRFRYNVQYLYYRNSLGGIECQCLFGDKEFRQSILKRMAEQVRDVDIRGILNLSDERPITYSAQRPTRIVHTGFIPLKQLDKLRDLLLHPNAYERIGIKHRPLTVLTEQANLFATSDELYSMSIELATGYDDENYSPDDAVEQGVACPSVRVLSVSQQLGSFLNVYWELPPGYEDIEIEYAIGATTYTAEFIGNTGSANIQVQNNYLSADVTCKVRARVICNNEVTPFNYGPYTLQESINISASLRPIANPDLLDELPRQLGTYILQVGGIEHDFLANDVPLNVGALHSLIITDSVGASTSTSDNGATVTPLSGGRIQYVPTSSSLLNNAIDRFYYCCRELLLSVPTMFFATSAPIAIEVAMQAQKPKIYAKIRIEELNREYVKFGFLWLYKRAKITTNIFCDFYLDAACTIPANTTGLGYLLAWKQQAISNNVNNAGSITYTSTNYSAVSTLAISGTSIVIALGYESALILTPTLSGCLEVIKKLIHEPASTVGDIVYVGWN